LIRETKRVPCQVRSETQSPCVHLAVVEIRGIPFCEACAREQEAYFAIGELTWETQEPGIQPPGKAFGEAMERIARRRADSLAAVGRLDFLALAES
jgi:hypothetical protein